MPGGTLGGSYTSLEYVYKGTTLPQPKINGGVFDSLKRVLSNTMLGPHGASSGGSDPLIVNSDPADAAVIMSR